MINSQIRPVGLVGEGNSQLVDEGLIGPVVTRKESAKRERNISIDILKFIAVLFISNSHMNYVYGDYSALATGGAIGDVLFFFCSGFTLLLGRAGRFDTWYKRRIRRIYPSVFGWAIVASFIMGMDRPVGHTLLQGGGWFVTCIMLYYVILYFVRKFGMDKLKWVFGAACVAVVLWYLFLFEEKEHIHMYQQSFHGGNDYFRWCHYFLFMLLGAMVGVNPINDNDDDNHQKNKKPLKVIGILATSFVAYFGFLALGKKYEVVSEWQILSLIPLLVLTLYMYKFCCLDCVKRLFSRRGWNWVMMVIGGLCLEIYLVQMPMLMSNTLPFGLKTDMIQDWFPMNIPVLLIIILLMAYITRSVGRWFAQTFDSMDGYDWKKIFALK